jgi:hypothetical protein
MVVNYKELEYDYDLANEIAIIGELHRHKKTGKYVWTLGYSDYGGDIIQQAFILYLKSKKEYRHLLHNVWVGYNGSTERIVNQKLIHKVIESSRDYFLGFEGIEEFFYNLEYEAKQKEIEYVLNLIREEGYVIPSLAKDRDDVKSISEVIEDSISFIHSFNCPDYNYEAIVETLLDLGHILPKPAVELKPINTFCVVRLMETLYSLGLPEAITATILEKELNERYV